MNAERFKLGAHHSYNSEANSSPESSGPFCIGLLWELQAPKQWVPVQV